MISSVRFSARLFFPLLALVLVALGCARQESTTDQSAAIDTSTQAMPAAGPTDAEIAAIVVDYNNVEISLAKAAQGKGKSPKVKEFAERMITDHTGVNKQATDLATRLSLTPMESDGSRKLTADGTAFEQSMKGMSGADLDRAYIANEVALHQQVLDLFDGTLIPSAQNPDLKALLEQVRPAVAAHLEHAKTLQSGLTATSQATGQ